MNRVAVGGAGFLLAILMAIPLLLAGGGSTGASAAAAPNNVVAGPPGVAHVVPLAPALPGVPAGGYPDAFPWGQCTYWAAYNHRVSWGGDAWQWVANAAAQGVASTATPAVGEIVVYGRSGGYNTSFGHVAIVIGVTPQTYTISEMNYSGLGVVDNRTIRWPDASVLGFIP